LIEREQPESTSHFDQRKSPALCRAFSFAPTTELRAGSFRPAKLESSGESRMEKSDPKGSAVARERSSSIDAARPLAKVTKLAHIAPSDGGISNLMEITLAGVHQGLSTSNFKA